MKARTVVGRGDKRSLSNPGSNLRARFCTDVEAKFKSGPWIGREPP